MKRRKRDLQQPAELRVFEGFNMRTKGDRLEWRVKNEYGTLLLSCSKAELESCGKEDTDFDIEYPERPATMRSDFPEWDISYERVIQSIDVILHYGVSDLRCAERYLKRLDDWFMQPACCRDCIHNEWRW